LLQILQELLFVLLKKIFAIEDAVTNLRRKQAVPYKNIKKSVQLLWRVLYRFLLLDVWMI